MSSGNDGRSHGSSELNRSSLGHHGRTSRRQNRQSFTTSWLAAQEEQQASAVQSSAQPEFVTPAITLTQPTEELGNEESEVLVPGSEEQLELEEVEGEELKGDGRDERHKVLSPPLSTSAKTGTGGWHGRLSATVIVDQPIAEEDEEAEEGGGDGEGKGKEKESGGVTKGSRWGHVRSRALSYPVSSPGSTLQAMLQLPRTQTLEEEGGEREGASGGASETKSKGSDGEPSAVVKFVQMALMAKKWKNRSNEERTSSRTSREMLFDRQKRRPLVEIPRCLKLEVAEEAYHIVHKTLQRYRSELGLRHKLTLQAEQHCETLAQQLSYAHYSTHRWTTVH